MTSHLDSHTTTDVKPKMISDVQPEMELHMMNIIYVGITHVRVRTNRKDNIFIQTRFFYFAHELGEYFFYH